MVATLPRSRTSDFRLSSSRPRRNIPHLSTLQEPCSPNYHRKSKLFELSASLGRSPRDVGVPAGPAAYFRVLYLGRRSINFREGVWVPRASKQHKTSLLLQTYGDFSSKVQIVRPPDKTQGRKCRNVPSQPSHMSARERDGWYWRTVGTHFRPFVDSSFAFLWICRL